MKLRRTQNQKMILFLCSIHLTGRKKVLGSVSQHKHVLLRPYLQMISRDCLMIFAVSNCAGVVGEKVKIPMGILAVHSTVTRKPRLSTLTR